MNIYSIYKITNKINHKVYIGFDSKWPNRLYRHFYISKSKKSKHNSLHKAIIKYGWENFLVELIYQSPERNHTLKIMEPFFINEYNSYHNGYNQTKGGEGTFGKKVSKQNRDKLSEMRKSLNKQSRWYNNGKENKFCTECPGDNWTLGRLNQKPSTKGYKWYNDGFNQQLTKNPPKNWKLGMLPKKQRSDFHL